METGAITGYIDVAQLVLYLFWAFFFTLVFWLHRESKREGYPLEPDTGNGPMVQGFPSVPKKKTFLLPDGSEVQVPREKPEPEYRAWRVAHAAGSPYEPEGDPMLSAMGPGAYANREDVPDAMFDGTPRLQPLRILTDFHTDPRDPNPVGLELVGMDGVVGGRIVDVWADRAEHMLRYYEFEKVGAPEAPPAPEANAAEESADDAAVEDAGTEEAVSAAPGASTAPQRALVPVTFTQIPYGGWTKQVKVMSIKGEHFANVPELASPDVVTLLEEDKIAAYFGGGHLFADPSFRKPLL